MDFFKTEQNVTWKLRSFNNWRSVVSKPKGLLKKIIRRKKCYTIFFHSQNIIQVGISTINIKLMTILENYGGSKKFGLVFNTQKNLKGPSI